VQENAEKGKSVKDKEKLKVYRKKTINYVQKGKQ
jgi:hypothetical protein